MSLNDPNERSVFCPEFLRFEAADLRGGEDIITINYSCDATIAPPSTLRYARLTREKEHAAPFFNPFTSR